jgi:short-subunit dehydrogenase
VTRAAAAARRGAPHGPVRTPRPASGGSAPGAGRSAGAPLALVTGASSGIGLELVRLLARDGHELLLAGRDHARLESVAAEARRLGSPAVAVVAADLSAPDGVERVLEAVATTGRGVAVLVNNAGAGAAGPFAESDASASLDMIQLNVTALTHLTRALLPDLLAAPQGRVLNVASTAAFQPGPYLAVYYATKAFVLSFSEALGEELAPHGVSVTALCPGPTATGFQRRAGIGDGRGLHRFVTADAASVARAGYDGMRRGRRVVIPGLANRLLVQAGRFAPRALVRRVAGAMNRGRLVEEADGG